MKRTKVAIIARLLPAILVLWVAGAAAQDVEDDAADFYKNLKPGRHPYLFFAAEDIPRLCEKMKVSPTKELWQRTRERCDRFFSKPCKPYPADTYYEQVRSRAEYIEGAAFAYVMTGQKRYADRAIQEIEALLDCPHWVETHVVRKGKLRTLDRVTARVAFVMAVAYDWLYDDLTPDQRERIRRDTAQKAIVPLLRAASEKRIGWLSWYRGNWAMGTYGQIGTAALAFLGEEKDAPKWLALATEHVRRGLAEGGRDGGWGEGLQYYAAAWSPPCKFAYALKRVTEGGENLFDHEFLRNTYQFPLYFLMPDRKLFVRFGNCSIGPSASAYFLFFNATEHQNQYAQWMAGLGISEMWGTFRTIYAFIAYDHRLDPKPPTNLPPAKHFRGVDWAVFRSGWESPDDVFFAFKGGTGDWDHIHGDFNSFTLYAYGSRLLVDLGYVHDVWGCRTEAHNTIRVNDKDQFPHTRPAGGARKPEHFCRISEFVHTEFYDHLIGDATTAYDPNDVEKATREVMYIRPDTFAIFDDVLTTRPLDVDWSVHTYGDLALNGDVITVTQDDAAVDIVVVQPQTFTHEILSKKNDTFIKIRRSDKETRSRFLTVLRPRRLDQKPKLRTSPIVQGDLVGVEIERDGLTALALFGTAESAISYGDVSTDARSCLAVFKASRLVRVAIHGGSRFAYQGRTVLQSTEGPADSLAWKDDQEP